MTQRLPSRRVSRRDFLRLGGGGFLASVLGGALPASAAPRSLARQAAARVGGWIINIGGTIVQPVGKLRRPPLQGAQNMHLVATDGFISLPGRRSDPVFVFGFTTPDPERPLTEYVDDLKGKAQIPAPILAFNQNTPVYLRMTNIGLIQRPDLDDSHTVHWHGFPNAISFFDGEPNASIAVPVARTFEYFYRPIREGTYLYHCHFEDTEHITMGMTSVVLVRPAGGANYAYNDPTSNADPTLRTPDPSTQFDREFVMFLTDMDTTEHDHLRDVQENDFSDFHANYFLLNGRAYPDTLLPNGDASLPEQPVSSVVNCNAGERVLLRFASLSFNVHAIQVPGIPLRVIGKDARLLRGRNGEDQSYFTHTIHIGAGETTDAIFTAPNVSSPTTYRLASRNFNQLSNGGGTDAGGMLTEIRVNPAGTLGPQVGLNG